ncbi:MAG: ABC transporter permease [Acidobacteriaceae bacterium]
MRWWPIAKRTTDAEREIQSDLELEEEEQRDRGLASDEARYAALRAFGNPALIRDQTHAVSPWPLLESLLRDIRFALRALRRTPGFTAVAIVVMALGIGANVALFTVVRGVILKPLPFQDPQRLVMLYESGLRDGDAPSYNLVAGGIYSAWKKQNQTLASMSVVRGSRVQLSGSGQLPEKLSSGELSWDLLPTLGVQPALGRNFTSSDDSPSGGGTVLLSWALWKRRFGGDPRILNHTVSIDAKPMTVIGVMPAWFTFPNASTQVWLPVYQQRPDADMKSFSLHQLGVVGRLRPGVAPAQAIADLSLISRHIRDANLGNPFIYQGANSRLLLDHMVGDMKRPLWVLLGATACVLLIACLNVANLLVARAAARRRDLAIRTALGGGRLRLIRERLLESLLLSLFGWILGLGFARVALLWLLRTRQDIYRADSIHFDGVVAVFTIGVVCLCAFLSGLISTFSTRDKSILTALHEGSRALGGARSKTRLRRSLLSLEVSLTVVLLIGAGLLLKSYQRLRSSDMGCLTRNVLTLHTGIPDARYAPGAPRVTFFDTLLDRIRALPGVTAASFVDAVPGQDYSKEQVFTIVEHPPLPQGKGTAALRRTADPKYFATIGIPLVGGRTLNPARRLDDADEIMVDQLFVRRFFPGEEPLGRHIRIENKNYRIVGVVGSTRIAIGEDPRPTMYTSLKAGNESVGTIVIRSREDVAGFALPVQRIVADIDPDLVVSDVLTMDQLLGRSTISASFNATLLVAFAALSLLLAAAGLFGVLSYIAAQRTREIGVRIALGAQRAQVLELMLVDGIRPAIFGLAIGLAAGMAVARLLRSMLYQTPALDPGVLVGVAVLLLLVAMVACVLPAWRASRLDPVQALRTE